MSGGVYSRLQPSNIAKAVTLHCLALPYLILPYLTLPYLTLPYLTLPYLTLPYLTLPYLTLPYLPYLTLHEEDKHIQAPNQKATLTDQPCCCCFALQSIASQAYKSLYKQSYSTYRFGLRANLTCKQSYCSSAVCRLNVLSLQ